MKKLIIFLLLATPFLFTACEQPEGPQSLIGHWNVVGDHWTATFEENGELIISSTKYDCFHPYHYKAIADSLYISSTLPYTADGQEDSNEYACAYSFKGNTTLVIEKFGAIFENIGTVADNIKKKESVVLTRSVIR